MSMSIHDPALVERVAQAQWADSDLDREENPQWFATDDHRHYWLGSAVTVLDLLVAEGRLCEPGSWNRSTLRKRVRAAEQACERKETLLADCQRERNELRDQVAGRAGAL